MVNRELSQALLGHDHAADYVCMNIEAAVGSAVGVLLLGAYAGLGWPR